MSTHDLTRPLVVQYLYVHAPDEAFYYPTARSASSSDQLAQRYLECALTQAATLRLRDASCDLALATNAGDCKTLGRKCRALLERIEGLGVQILPTEYMHRPRDNRANYVASRYLLDAILSGTEGQPADRQLWLTDLDCVWVDAERMFDAAPQPPEIGCIFIGYGADCVAGISEGGNTRGAIAELASTIGAYDQGPPPWIGGELLTGRPGPLRALVDACEQIDAELADRGVTLAAEEEIITLASALGLARFRDLSIVCRRMSTGPRDNGAKVDDPLALGLWHLPAEKGLSIRRSADELLAGREARLRTDLANPRRLARRFNVAGTGLLRRVRDDGWIAGQRLRATAHSVSRRA